MDGFRFLIKSRVDSLNVRFQVRTLDVEEYANKPRQDHEGDEYGFHSYDFTVIPGVWQEVVVPVEDLELPGSWAADFEFDITRCTKLAWELFDTDGLQIDTLDVADVSLYSDYHTAHWNRTPVFNEEYSLPPVSGSVFASFDCGPVNMSPLGTWWSGFNDTEYGGTSHVDENFAYFDSTTGLLNIEFQYGTGSDGQGIGAVYEYELGPTLTENANVLGHIGIFVDLYDSSKARYFNADEENVHSVYFEYQTTGARYLTFELYDSCDVGDSNTPERFYSRGFKRVFHRHLPATGGSWRKVQIPFDALLLSRRPGVSPYWPLATTHLAKMRWVVYGEEGSEGYMAIDNIFLRDGAFGGTEECHSSVQLSRKHDSRNAGLHITSRGNSIRLSVSDQLKIKNGRIRIFNSHGVTLQNCEISGVNRLPIQFSTKGYSTGLYFIQVDGIGKEGGSFSFTEKVSIVK